MHTLAVLTISRQLIHGCAADMLVVHRLPEWPAAATALVRFVGAVSGPGGLKHSENSVRQCCVDLLGILVSQLYFEASLVEQERLWLCQVQGGSTSCDALLSQQLACSSAHMHASGHKPRLCQIPLYIVQHFCPSTVWCVSFNPAAAFRRSESPL